MGFLSNLFSKKTSIVSSKTPIVVNNKSNNHDLPPYQGDYAKAVFLWAHDKASPVHPSNDYPRYIMYECGIANPSAYHLGLIDEGYFEAAPTVEMLSSLKVADLKQFLSSIGQSSTGKKDVLIERISQNADDSTIKSFFPHPMYVLSKIGRSFIEEHHNYILLHTHKQWDIGWKEFDAKHHPNFSFYDTVWGILNERVTKDTKLFGRNEYLSMYQLLAEEGKRAHAIEMLLTVIYIDFSGVSGMEHYRLYKDRIFDQKHLLDFFDVIIMIAPGLIKSVYEYKDVYSDDIIDRLYEHKLPVQICDKFLFLKIVQAIFNDTYTEEWATQQLKVAYKKFVKSL